MRLRLSIFITLCSVASFSFADSQLAAAQLDTNQPDTNQLGSNQLDASQENTSTWVPYPESLPQFDYSGDLLAKHWPVLSAGTQLAWPDSAQIKYALDKYPQLSQQLNDRARKTDSHPALQSTLNHNYQPLAKAIQQVWRLHYQGQFEQAYTLGMELGPAGLLPALYSKLIHTTLLVSKKHKEAKFLEIDALMQPWVAEFKDFEFLAFGDLYQKMRRLELLSTSAASSSGLIDPTQDRLEKLHKNSPNHPIYGAMLAGIKAGIIERVGGFLGSMTYGADEDTVIELFEDALSKEQRLAVLYNEYSLALIRLDDSDYNTRLKELLNTCINLTVYSAEEALNQQVCRKTLDKL